MSENFGSKDCCGGNNSACVQTRKVYGSCKDKECLENLRVFLTASGQNLVNNAVNVKCKKVEIVWIYTDVEPVAFNRGYYTVDLKFFFRVSLDVYCGVCKPTPIEGLATYDKKVVLFGSEGNAKIFSSQYRENDIDINFLQKSNLPVAQVEVVEPIALDLKVIEPQEKCCCVCCCDVASIPNTINGLFDERFVDDEGDRKVLLTLGLFSIVRLERDVQLIVPVDDFCVPECDCTPSNNNNPCDLFDRISFPVEEFFPPERNSFDPLNTGRKKGCE